MNITFECRGCGSPGRIDVTSVDSALVCPSCSISFAARKECVRQGEVCACLLCGTQDIYIQKDFPHRLGITIVGVGFLLSTWAWFQYNYPLAIGILLATTGLDLCLYYLIGEVAVCYRCLAQYRSIRKNRDHRPYDLAVGERYRQERLRMEGLREVRRRRNS